METIWELVSFGIVIIAMLRVLLLVLRTDNSPPPPPLTPEEHKRLVELAEREAHEEWEARFGYSGD